LSLHSITAQSSRPAGHAVAARMLLTNPDDRAHLKKHPSFEADRKVGGHIRGPA
jgi:hypothetical protein